MPVGSRFKTRWEDQVKTAYLLNPSTGLPMGGFSSPVSGSVPDLHYVGGTSFSLDGTDPKWVDVPQGVAYIEITAQGGEVFYELNGMTASANSPGYCPEDGTRLIGPVCNLVRLYVFSATADTAVHVSYFTDGRSVPEYEPEPPGPWWDPGNEGLCVWAAYASKGAASFAASLTDLTGNGNDAGDPGGAATPSWSAANGWEFNAANSEYLTTTFVPAADQSQSILVQFSDKQDNQQSAIAGSWRTPGDDNMFFLVPGWSNANAYYGNGNALTTVIGGEYLSGNAGIAGNQGYRDGLAHGGLIAGTTQVGLAVYIGCRNYDGAAANFLTGYIQALAIYDCTITAGQVLAVETAMEAL